MWKLCILTLANFFYAGYFSRKYAFWFPRLHLRNFCCSHESDLFDGGRHGGEQSVFGHEGVMMSEQPVGKQPSPSVLGYPSCLLSGLLGTLSTQPSAYLS